MKKIFLLLFLIIFVTASVFSQITINDPNAVKVDVKNFHSIQISGAFNVYLIQSNEDGVAISAADDKYRDNIKVEVNNGVLKIYFDNKSFLKGIGGRKLKAYISIREIKKLSASGACNVFLDGVIKAETLKLAMSGASDLKGNIEVKKLSVDLSGASDVIISGTALQTNIKASGASDFKGYELVTDICNVTASGASSIQVTVDKELSAQASGASDIRYKGDGVIREIKSSGASSVTRKS